MKKRLCIVFLLLFASLCVLTACGSTPDAQQTESPNLLDMIRAAASEEIGIVESDDAWEPETFPGDTYTDSGEPEQQPPISDELPVTPETWGIDDVSETWTIDDVSETWSVDDTPDASEITEDGAYTTKNDVALYLHLYGHLPGNFITKKEAKALGWGGGSLEQYAPGKCIGGDRFGNYEKLLPVDRSYHECDINTLGAKSRGAERLVFSGDGLIYYTGDHYNTFTLLYGTP